VAATVSATVQGDTASILVEVSGISPAVNGYVYREEQSGTRTSVGDTGLIVWNAGGYLGTDSEAPLDVPLRYLATDALNATQATSEWVTLPSGGFSWLKAPGVPSLNTPIKIVTIGDRTRAKPQAVFRVIGRELPVVVTSRRWAPTMTLTAYTETNDEYRALLGLLGLGSVLLLSTPAATRYGSMYVDVGEVTEHSHVDVYDNPVTVWTLPLTQTERPAGIGTGIAGNTWGDVVATYPTWGDLIARKATWGDLVRRVAP
jgi:hypothetical protein